MSPSFDHNLFSLREHLPSIIQRNVVHLLLLNYRLLIHSTPTSHLFPRPLPNHLLPKPPEVVEIFENILIFEEKTRSMNHSLASSLSP